MKFYAAGSAIAFGRAQALNSPLKLVVRILGKMQTQVWRSLGNRVPAVTRGREVIAVAQAPATVRA